jgi:hypothetical protein
MTRHPVEFSVGIPLVSKYLRKYMTSIPENSNFHIHRSGNLKSPIYQGRPTIQSVPGGKVNILSHSIGHFKKKSLCEHVSYSERFPILARSILNMARNIFLPSHRTAPMSEECKSVWSVSWLLLLLVEREGRKYCAPNSKYWPQILETVRNRTHVYINFFLRMTDTMTSQNTDLSSWDALKRIRKNTRRNFVSLTDILVNIRTGHLCVLSTHKCF